MLNVNMSSEYSYGSENGFDEMSSSSDSGFDVSFESPRNDHHLAAADTTLLFNNNCAPGGNPLGPLKEKKKNKRNTRCRSPTQVRVYLPSVYEQYLHLPFSITSDGTLPFVSSARQPHHQFNFRSFSSRCAFRNIRSPLPPFLIVISQLSFIFNLEIFTMHISSPN